MPQFALHNKNSKGEKEQVNTRGTSLSGWSSQLRHRPSRIELLLQLGLRRRKKRQKIVSNSLPYFTPRRETYVDSIDIDVGDDPVFPLHVFSVYGKRQVLGHNSVLLNDFHARRLEVLCEQAQRVVVVEFGTV